MMNLCPIFGLVAAFFTIATNSFHINLHLYEYINSAWLGKELGEITAAHSRPTFSIKAIINYSRKP